MREECGHVTGARADFEHAFVLLDRQFLQDARFDTREKHVLPFGQRQFQIGECDIAIGGVDEVFAFDDR